MCYRYSNWMTSRGFTCKSQDPWYAELVRYQFFKDHPTMTTWRGQVHKYLLDMSNNLQHLTINEAIQSWNPAAVGYVATVRSRVGTVQYLLSQ